jgi:mono/diheme cytochrome c family protein
MEIVMILLNFLKEPALMMSKRYCINLILLGLVFISLACGKDKNTRELQYMPDMYVSPAIKAQEADPENPGQSLMREPVTGTIPRDGIIPYQIAAADTLAANDLINPLPVTEEVLASGRKYFDIYCTVCHGPNGAGDGPIIPKMTKPPVIYSEKVTAWTDGRIYHTITHGQGNMPSYKSSVDPMTRWAIIHYVRVLQKAQNPTEDDLKKLSDRE